MAKTTSLNGDTAYVVSDAVGYRETNRMADVLLVQYLLSLAVKASIFHGGLGGCPPLGPGITVDGVYGQETHYWSMYFLGKHNLDDSGGVFEDPTKFTGERAFPMKRLLGAARHALGRADFESLPESPRTPPALRRALGAAGKKVA